MITIEWDAEKNEARIRTPEESLTVRFDARVERSNDLPAFDVEAIVFNDQNGIQIRREGRVPAWIVVPLLTFPDALKLAEFVEKEIKDGILHR